MTLWVVRAGKYGEHESDVLDRGVVAIGYSAIGNLTQFIDLDEMQSWEEMKAEYRRIEPDANERSIGARTGALWTFAREIKIGDNVVLPLKSQSAIALACVQSEYEYRPDFPEGMRHTRRVQWKEKVIPRSEFDRDILGSFGAFRTVYQARATNAEERVLAQFAGQPPPATPPTEDREAAVEEEPALNLISAAEDLVVKQIERDFKGHDLAALTGAILEAQGYEVKVSPPGPDGGVDVFAGRGGLGLEAPRVCVQVKSGVSVSDVNVFRGLQGAMSSFGADYGLLVSWGGFTRPLRQEAQQHYFKIRLWDQGDLVHALLDVYEKLPEAMQAKLPLERIWIPVQSDEEE